MSKAERRRKAVADALKAALGDQIICKRCQATLETFGDVCKAALPDPCPGFVKIEEHRQPIVRRIYRLK